MNFFVGSWYGPTKDLGALNQHKRNKQYPKNENVKTDIDNFLVFFFVSAVLSFDYVWLPWDILSNGINIKTNIDNIQISKFGISLVLHELVCLKNLILVISIHFIKCWFQPSVVNKIYENNKTHTKKNLLVWNVFVATNFEVFAR
jgi:hypothetical protein